MKKKVSFVNSEFTGTANSLLLELLYALQKIDSEFPIQYAICLAEIAENEGCSLTALAEKTGLALSTVSRITGALSEYRQKGAAYGFIEMRVSPEERRRKELHLTAAGRVALRSLLSVLEK